MSELGELEDLATLAVFQFSDYKDNPGRDQITLYQFFVYREATDEERLLWRSIIHLIDDQDVSLYASKTNDTETDPRSKRCSMTFQGHVEKKFTKGY
jgi:hypothetical protein